MLAAAGGPRRLRAGVIELFAADEVECRGRRQRALRIDHGLGAYQADEDAGILLLEHFSEARIGWERRCARMHDDQTEVARNCQRLRHIQPVRGRIEQAGIGYQRRRLCQPGWKPEGLDLPLGLVARTRAAIEAVEGRGLQEECPDRHGRLPQGQSEIAGAVANALHLQNFALIANPK